jgi:hypothetical protein
VTILIQLRITSVFGTPELTRIFRERLLIPADSASFTEIMQPGL